MKISTLFIIVQYLEDYVHRLVPLKWERAKSVLSEGELKILSLCATPMSITELMTAIGWKSRAKFRKRFIMPLLEQGLFTMTIPGRPNSRLHKYLATKRRLEILPS